MCYKGLNIFILLIVYKGEVVKRNKGGRIIET